MKPKVIKYVVEKNMCTGCGTCVASTKNKFLKMELNKHGFITPIQTSENFSELEDDISIGVCPFNPNPKEEVKNEDVLGQYFLKNTKNYDDKIGKFNDLFVGYSNEFRSTSSSGGIATFIFNHLLKNKIVNHVVCVRESENESKFYEYNIISDVNNILQSSKTKYYPVTMAESLDKISMLEGNVAVVGVACFIKSIRLLQKRDEFFNKKINFLIGIICGGVKSSFFAEYLASKAGVDKKNYRKPDFRIKDVKSAALDYSFGCTDKKTNKLHTVKMKSVGDMWGTGLFKANACDFCEDVTTELADISLGDAWIQPYSSDGKGNSIIISRSDLASEILNRGVVNNELNIEKVSKDKIIASQSSSFKHRQDALNYRMKITKNEGMIHSPKRKRNLKSINLTYRLVQKQRRLTRKNSILFWEASNNHKEFEEKLFKNLDKLKFYTKVYHYSNAIKNKLKIYGKK